MKFILFAAVLFAIAAAIWAVWLVSQRKARRREFIRQYRFPAALRSKLLFKHPDLDETQTHQVLEGLRQFFLICLEINAVRARRSIGMPSKIVDDAWHEFILMSREYSRFCTDAFGTYLHHTPAEASDEASEKGLLRTLHVLKTKSPGAGTWAMMGGIPLLFALDKAMAVEGGQHYDDTSLAELDEKRKAWLQSQSGDASMDWSSDSGRDSGSGSDAGGSDGGGGSGCSGGGGCGGGGCGS